MKRSIRDVPQQVSESVRRLNPHLYGVGKVEACEPKPIVPEALVCRHKKQKRSSGGVEIRISFIAMLPRLLDDDNLAGSLKPLRDEIARDLGIDDGDQSLHFEYGQIKSDSTGVIVKFDAL